MRDGTLVTTPNKESSETRFLRIAIVLGLLSAIGPFAIDMYLPALPSIGKDLTTDPATVQMSLLAFFVTMGLGQIVVGPISDMIGRKGPMYLGLGLFVLGSIGSAVAPWDSLVDRFSFDSRVRRLPWNGGTAGRCPRSSHGHRSRTLDVPPNARFQRLAYSGSPHWQLRDPMVRLAGGFLGGDCCSVACCYFTGDLLERDTACGTSCRQLI
jgi:MFS transporter